MQSISAQSISVHPLSAIGEDADYDVLHLDKLLNKIFGDQLDRALADGNETIDFGLQQAEEVVVDSSAHEPSNLIEFPLIQELVSFEDELIARAGTLDFSPMAFGADDPVLETDLTRFTPSIIERDDSDSGHLQAIVDVQQEQLANLRAELRQKDIIIRSQAVDRAAKDDQLKYLPGFFEKALRLANVEALNLLLTKDLEVEKLLNEELHQELVKCQGQLSSVNNSLLVKFGRILGVVS